MLVVLGGGFARISLLCWVLVLVLVLILGGVPFLVVLGHGMVSYLAVGMDMYHVIAYRAGWYRGR